MPIGIRGYGGKIVTNSFKVKQIIKRKYIQRIRKRPSNPNIQHIMEIKEGNAQRIINIAREVKTPPWTHANLERKISVVSKRTNVETQME